MSGAQQRPVRRQSRPPQRGPDIMIGAITLALLAGFGTLLLGERNRPQVVAQTPPPATPAIPSSPGTVPEPAPAQTQPAPPAQTTEPQTTQPQTTQPQATQPEVTQPQAVTPSASTTPATQASQATAQQTTPPAATTQQTPSTTTPSTSTASNVAQTSEIPPVPKAPPVEPIKPPVLPQATTQQTAPQQQVQTPATTAQPQQQPSTPATPAVAQRAGGAVATSENRVPLRSDYRISLGSFSTRKTVESQTSGVRGLGYTVHAIDLGDQYVAQIGPFASEEAARQALADIQRAYPSALLYRPRNAAAQTDNTTSSNSTTSTDNTTSSTSSSSSGSTATPAAPAQTETPRPQAAAPSGPTYLQVGAFDREESAQRLVGILHDNGFNPTVNSPEGRKTTVMVGPYSGDALLRAEARLDNASLDHFRVR